jgi:hypothetical protein
MARTGLFAKGLVYLTLGILAFMAAFEIGGQKDSETDRSGVFSFLKDAPAGSVLLGLLTIGLVCYSAWRIIQTITVSEKDNRKKWSKKLRYLFSGLTYLSVAYTALRIILSGSKKNGDKNQEFSSQILNQPFGQVLLGIGALLIAGNGIYQIWYGLSEKYKKHVDSRSFQNGSSAAVLVSGKIGYVARGVVWLVISFLLIRAALHSNASEAGDTGKAFQFIESGYGSWLLGATGLGLVAYGVFNFIRSRYEKFG